MPIVTFYSYKGGVGRTLAVANVGYALAKTGRSVLMIDFDLEAPGLSRMCKGLDFKSITHLPGLVELLIEEAGRIRSGEATSFATLADYCTPVLLPPYSETGLPDARDLQLLGAGAINVSYGDRLTNLDLGQHFAPPDVEMEEKLRSGDFFTLFRHRLLSQFDYVLIDSRTGHSDEMGISTQVLADQIVLVVGMNEQNLMGAIDQVQYWREVTPVEELGSIVVLMSPTPLGYEQEIEERKIRLRREIEAQWYGEAPEVLSIPYHPRLAMGEWTFSATDPESEIGIRYRDLTRQITERFEGSPNEQLSALIGSTEQGRHVDALESAQKLVQEYPEFRSPLVERLAFVLTERQTGSAVQHVLDGLASYFADDAELTRRIGEAFAHVGSWTEAQRYFKQVRTMTSQGGADWCRASAEILRGFLRAGGAEALSFARDVMLVLGRSSPETGISSSPQRDLNRYEAQRAAILCGRVAVEAGSFEEARTFALTLLDDEPNDDDPDRHPDQAGAEPYALRRMRQRGARDPGVVAELAAIMGEGWRTRITGRTALGVGRTDDGMAASERVDPFLPSAMRVVGDSVMFEGRRSEAARWYGRSFTLCESMEDRTGAQRSAARIGYLLNLDQNCAGAGDVARALISLARASDDRHGLARACCLAAQVAMRTGDLERAEELLNEARTQFRDSTRSSDGLVVQRLVIELRRLRGDRVPTPEIDSLVEAEVRASRPYRAGQAAMTAGLCYLLAIDHRGRSQWVDSPSLEKARAHLVQAREQFASVEAQPEMLSSLLYLQCCDALSGPGLASATEQMTWSLRSLREYDEWLDGLSIAGWVLHRRAIGSRQDEAPRIVGAPADLRKDFMAAWSVARDFTSARAADGLVQRVGRRRLLDVLAGVALGLRATGGKESAEREEMILRLIPAGEEGTPPEVSVQVMDWLRTRTGRNGG